MQAASMIRWVVVNEYRRFSFFFRRIPRTPCISWAFNSLFAAVDEPFSYMQNAYGVLSLWKVKVSSTERKWNLLHRSSASPGEPSQSNRWHLVLIRELTHTPCSIRPVWIFKSIVINWIPRFMIAREIRMVHEWMGRVVVE